MSKYLGTLVIVLWAAACGGTTDTAPDSPGGGANGGGAGAGGGAAGTSHGGSGTAGSVSTGGSLNNGGNGGSLNNGGKAGSVGNGGTVAIGGSVGLGGSGGADPRCPPRLPTGSMCSDDQSGATCQYNQFNSCLCFRSAAFVYPCPQVDPTCPNGGSGGAGGAASTGGSAGAGGITTKVAAPPTQVCTCAAGVWNCNYGF